MHDYMNKKLSFSCLLMFLVRIPCQAKELKLEPFRGANAP